MSKKGLTEKQVAAVLKALKAGQAPVDIAKTTGIKPSTVKAIRQAGSFGEFEKRRLKKAQYVSARRAMRPAPLPTTFKAGVTGGHGGRVTVSETTRIVSEKEARKLDRLKAQTQSALEPAVSAYDLNEAYKENRARQTATDARISDVEATAHEEHRINALSVRQLEKSLFDLQKTVMRHEHKLNQPWYKRLFR